MSKAKSAETSGKKGKGEKPEKTAAEKARGNRETVESIIIAVILAFLFRAFEAEAFVIPTGSMAPTLQGRHFDVKCEKCQHRYRTGASDESSILTATTCPICRYTMRLDFLNEPDECPMSGDRILVNKFAFELKEPQRWDIIVFKYPGNAKVNYIKRLVGLPGERVRVQYGNVYVRKQGDQGFRIARKPPDKVQAMLQLVDDTNYIPAELTAAGWPSRWQAWSPQGQAATAAWKANAGNASFACDGSAAGEAWLRYHHLIPDYLDWTNLENGEVPQDMTTRLGELITDFYAYNCNENAYPYPHKYEQRQALERELSSFRPLPPSSKPENNRLGSHWVGDLSVGCQAAVESDAGELLLDLIEGGVHYQCRINVADGTAALSIDGRFEHFQDERGAATKFPTAATAVKGKGKYRLQLANVDDQLFLWVNGWPVAFDGPTTYGPPTFAEPANVKPVWTPQDPGDLAPAGVGSKGAAVTVSSLRILRDVYYIATSKEAQATDDYERGYGFSETESIFSNPEVWERPNLLDRRRYVEFPYASEGQEFFGPDQFFPMGDNSPQSQDGRLWSIPKNMLDTNPPPPYVERQLLIGKALFIYWPHTWNRPIPYVTPNVPRMRLIK